jgi:N-sulfoglucosamine sulfohydrolase
MVLAELKKAGRLDNTLIIVIGDHGAPFGRAKVTCFNQGMRIPFIVKWPGVSKSGTATDSLVSTIDLLPTFLDAAGVDKPENLPGTSVRAAVADTSADLHKYIFGEFTAHLPADYFPQRTVRNKQYQLIENLVSPEPNPTPGIEGKSEREALANNVEMTTSAQAALQTYVNPPRFQLYDLQADPNNFNNLAGNPQYAKVQQELKSALDAWRKESNDPLLKPGEIERLRQEVREIKKLDDTKSRKPARRAPGARGGRKQSGDALATSPE